MKGYSFTAIFGSQERQLILQIKTQSATATRIGKPRTQLLPVPLLVPLLVSPLEHPFVGSMFFRLNGPKSSSAPTMEADGVSPFYHPVFVVTLSTPDLAKLMAQEVTHPALQFHTRRGIADQRAQQMRCDNATDLLLECGRIDLTAGARH